MKVMFFVLILSSVASIASSVTTNSLKQGDALNSSSYLVSANNNFTLGFFAPEGTNRTYLAIRFTQRAWERSVWIGNRETPLPTNSSPNLYIDASGRLILKGQGKPYLLSSKQTSLNVTATLLDSGNFVLREVNTDGSFRQELWSSFDNPTNTLLPGMKLGVNHRTGRNWSLTSWQDDDIPAPGAYSLEWDPSKRELVIKYRGVVHWTSGELMNATDFQHVSINFGNQFFKYSNVSTNGEENFSYTVTPNPILAGWRLDPIGSLSDSISNLMIIDVRDCYGYKNETQQSRGCELWATCRGVGQMFDEMSGRFMEETENGPQQVDGVEIQNSTASPGDCREICWMDC